MRPQITPSPKDFAIQAVKHDLLVEPSRETRIINVGYDSSDPALAASVANTLSETFIEQSVQARWNAARDVSEWLRPQLEDLKAKLEQSQDDLQAYLRDSGLQLTSGQENP